MKISPDYINIFSLKKNKKDCRLDNKNLKRPGFKAIYVEDNVRLGIAAQSHIKPEFLPHDELLLCDIADMYPNQDCFIRSGKSYHPRLEFREKPPKVTVFHENYAKYYEHDIEPNNEKYPCVPLILYPDSDLGKFIGLTSSKSLNPSLSYTIKAGYELHKKIMEKKYQIMDVIGHVDNFSLGEKNIIEKAHETIDDYETSILRYLLECSYTALTSSAKNDNSYEATIKRMQSRLNAKRRIDLTIPTANHPNKTVSEERIDICKLTQEEYPNTEENKKEMKNIIQNMQYYNLFLT